MRKVLMKHTYESRTGEVFTEPSMTVPDQALPLKKILSDYTRGVMPASIRNPEYHGEEYVPDLKSMDLSELADYMSDVRQEMVDLENEQKRRKSEAEKNALRDQILSEMEKTDNQSVEEISTTSP